MTGERDNDPDISDSTDSPTQHFDKGEPLSRHHNQSSDVHGLLSQAGSASKLSKALGKGLHGLSRHAGLKPAHSHPKVPGSTHNNVPADIFGKVSAAGRTVNDIAGVLSAFQQAYASEDSLKKADRKAISLLDSTTVEDILAARNSRLTERKPITRKELEKYVEKALIKQVKKQTFTAGITGLFTVAGLLGAGAFAFTPLLPVTLAAVGIGLAATALFSRINKNRARKKIRRLFSNWKINQPSQQSTSL